MSFQNILSTSLVQIKTLTCDQPRSNFDEEMIEQAAKLIVELGGIISPLIVKRTGINDYKLIHGHFEYYAALKAKEIDLEKCEVIAAYIIESEKQESLIKKQIALFR